MKTYIITEAQANALLGYLQTKPYSEVHSGVDMLTNLPEAPEAPAEFCPTIDDILTPSPTET